MIDGYLEYCRETYSYINEFLLLYQVISGREK